MSEDAEHRSVPLTLLVAEETTRIRELMANAVMVHDPGTKVVCAAEGSEALALFERHRPDVAFVSLDMPGMAGAEILSHVKAKGLSPISILSSKRLIGNWVELCRFVNAYEFLRKPFEPRVMAEILEACSRMRRPSRILVVDDSTSARHLVSRFLSRSLFKLQIDETDSGTHAVRLAEMESYDVALIDFDLRTSINGLETACRIQRAADTRVIMMSGYDIPQIEAGAASLGLSVFLRKPFFAQDLDAALHKVLGLRRPYLLNATAKGFLRTRDTTETFWIEDALEV
jgi:CheY-like chemotaxis protein